MNKNPNILPTLIRFTILDLVCIGIGIYFYLERGDIIYLLAGACIGSVFLVLGFVIPAARNKTNHIE